MKLTILARRPHVRAGVALLGTLALAAAGVPARSQDAQLPRDYGTQPFTPKDFTLPEGAGCAIEIARWQAVQDNDYRGGNIGIGVYRQIQTEIARAAAVCAAGRDGAARALVASSKSRHGYPQ